MKFIPMQWLQVSVYFFSHAYSKKNLIKNYIKKYEPNTVYYLLCVLYH